MHSLHCARNIALCTKCDEPVPRAELDQHNKELHADIACSLCGKLVEACKMEEHQVIKIFLSLREGINPALSVETLPSVIGNFL